MRTALLSAIRRDDAGNLRAGQLLAGRSVLEWQADWAMALGCERIICLCETPGDEVLALQRVIERKGGEFHAIRNSLQLAGIVRAEEDLVVLLDGFLPDRVLAGHWLREDGRLGRAIAIVPADHVTASEHPDDFERIDRERRWAGIAIMRAAQVHKLADLPPDGDTISMLLRLGLQAQVPCVALPEDAFHRNQVVLATSAERLAKREAAIVEDLSAIPPWSGPGKAAAAAIVRAIAPRWISSGVEFSFAGTVFFLAGGLILAGLGQASWALGLASIGAFLAAVCRAWSALRSRLWSTTENRRMGRSLEVALDLTILAILILVSGLWLETVKVPSLEAVTLSSLAIGLSHVLAQREGDRLAPWWGDRATHCLIFAICAAAGYLSEAISLFALAALAGLLLSRTRK